ncbi:MAG: hypothetical protein U9P00_04675 [Pseudomonadota bacterium]|nr:hypothetical protein [Pseudomonadota bacterium]
MELQLNLAKFEERQAIFVTELTKTIQVKLTEAGLESDKVKELTGALAFSITCMIDGISGIELDGMEVQPYLTFQIDDELVHCGENSFMHELIYEVLGRLNGD